MELREPLKDVTVTQGFGKDFLHYYNGKRVWFYKDIYGLKGHPGIDYRAHWATPIYSAHDGVVMYTGYDATNGNLVQIWNEEEGFKTMYGHNSEFKVKRGDKVKAGDLIALSGDTGAGTGPHLHFGLKLTGWGGNGVNNDNGYNGAIDPAPYIKYDYKGNNLYMNNERIKVLKDKNSSTVGFFLPAISEDVAKSYALNFGIEVPMVDTNSNVPAIDWDNFIDGEFSLNE